MAEVSQSDIEEDSYYQLGDYIGKQGVEKFYEKQLRGEKGMQIMLRDAHGRIQGSYMNGKLDRRPVPGKDLTLSIDVKLQALGERLLEGKIGSIVAIEPSTGEVLCMVSSPTYDPRSLTGRKRSKAHLSLARNPWKPLLNRSIMGMYPPGSTFKTTQGLTFLTEGIITPNTMFPCHHGFYCRGLHVGCHGHASPINLVPAIGTSCNGYFCWGLYYMLGNRKKYKTVQDAMNIWRDYMVSMGFGYKLGIDLSGEKRGLIPNAQYYDKAYKGSWNGLTVISIAIGQGEVLLTPLQIANLGATIANRGFYYKPHVVRKVQGEPLDTAYTHKHYTMANHRAYDYIVAGMRRAVLAGTCRAANSPYYEVCGKTGTAQNHGQDHSIFMGFAPMNEPKIAVAVYVENGGFGAEYGVPIGALMIEQYLRGKLSPESERKRKPSNTDVYLMVQQTDRQQSVLRSLDWWTIGIYLALLAFGWLSVCGASYTYGDADILSLDTRSGMQIVWIGTSICLGFVLLMLDDRFYDTFAYIIYGFLLLLLFVTIFNPHEIKGSRSWLVLGPLRVQPAEFAKFATALAVAKLMSTYGFNMHRWKDFAAACAVVVLPMLFIVLQKRQARPSFTFPSSLCFTARG